MYNLERQSGKENRTKEDTQDVSIDSEGRYVRNTYYNTWQIYRRQRDRDFCFAPRQGAIRGTRLATASP